MAQERIVCYGTKWCIDCRRAKAFLTAHRIDHEWIDVDTNPTALRFVEQVNKGMRSVPTIVFPDGSILVEPSNMELAKKLGIRQLAEA